MNLYAVDNGNGTTLKVLARNKTEARRVANAHFREHGLPRAEGEIEVIRTDAPQVVGVETW